MSRSTFGGTSVDWLVEPYQFGTHTLLALRTTTTTLTFWSAFSGGSQYTDLLNASATPVTTISVLGHQVPNFQGPDGILAMWADKGDGSPRELLEAQDLAAASSAAASLTSMVRFDTSQTLTSGQKTQALTNVGAVGKGDLVLNVKDYGAVGDGSTDDSTNMASAFTAARAAKARLRFGFGLTYIVSGTLDPTGVMIDGNGATLKIKAGVTPHWNVLQPTGGFHADRLTIDLNKTNTTNPAAATEGIGIYLYNATSWSDLKLRNVTVKNGYQMGIRLATGSAATDAASVPYCGAVLENVTVDACQWGIWVYAVGGVTLVNCTITNCTADGLYDFLAADTRVLGGRFASNGGHGIVTQYGRGTKVTDTHCVSNTGDGICVGGGLTSYTESRRYSIVGNHCYSNSLHGIALDPTKTGAATTPVPAYGVVTGNECFDNTIHGISLSNTDEVAITGNVCRGHTTNAAGCGISAAALGSAISGNTCRGNKYGVAFWGNAGSPNYGRHRVGVNDVSGNTLAGYTVESASVTNMQFATVTATVPSA
jgi:parallel beta-helix repeat protein